MIGYARCSIDAQDLTAQRDRLRELGVAEERIYLDHGLTGTNRKRSGLDQTLAAVRGGYPLMVPKLDRLARAVPDARAKGKLRGKQPRLSARQQREPVRMAGTGEFTIADLAEVSTVSRATVNRTLQRTQVPDKAR